MAKNDRQVIFIPVFAQIFENIEYISQDSSRFWFLNDYEWGVKAAKVNSNSIHVWVKRFT